MIKCENGIVSVKGTGKDLVKDAVAIVYSVRKIFESDPEILLAFDFNLWKILNNQFEENVDIFNVFNSKEELEAFKANLEAEAKRQQPTSLAEDIMRDIIEEQD